MYFSRAIVIDGVSSEGAAMSIFFAFYPNKTHEWFKIIMLFFAVFVNLVVAIVILYSPDIGKQFFIFPIINFIYAILGAALFRLGFLQISDEQAKLTHILFGSAFLLVLIIICFLYNLHFRR